jgi:AcrR family transcriptional regulator
MFYLMERYSKEMARRVKPPEKRTYDSSRRQAQARETQGAIALAARELFLERGYVATSVRDIAEHAGVAVQTIYNLFDGKPEIMRRIGDMTAVGDDEPVALADRDEYRELLELTDPVEFLERWIELSMRIFQRFEPLLPTLREASAADPAVAGYWRTNAKDNRYLGMTTGMQRLHELRALRDDVTVTTATDIMWTVVSFESFEALVIERGWTSDAYAAWALRAVRASILRD